MQKHNPMIIPNKDGTNTSYITCGNPDDEPMILLHGMGADHNMWSPQMQPFTDNGYFVIVPDLLGHGNSSYVHHLSLTDWEHQIIDLFDEHNIHHSFALHTQSLVTMPGVHRLIDIQHFLFPH